MRRFARIAIPGRPHHITQRGNHRRPFFFSDIEREFYLDLLQRHFPAQEILTKAYCLILKHNH